jgi:hypothetical protein
MSGRSPLPYRLAEGIRRTVAAQRRISSTGGSTTSRALHRLDARRGWRHRVWTQRRPSAGNTRRAAAVQRRDPRTGSGTASKTHAVPQTCLMPTSGHSMRDVILPARPQHLHPTVRRNHQPTIRAPHSGVPSTGITVTILLATSYVNLRRQHYSRRNPLRENALGDAGLDSPSIVSAMGGGSTQCRAGWLRALQQSPNKKHRHVTCGSPFRWTAPHSRQPWSISTE